MFLHLPEADLVLALVREGEGSLRLRIQFHFGEQIASLLYAEVAQLLVLLLELHLSPYHGVMISLILYEVVVVLNALLPLGMAVRDLVLAETLLIRLHFVPQGALRIAECGA